MQDPQNRDVMAAMYRILEKYEIPPDCDSDEQIVRYFATVRADIEEFYDTYWTKAHNEYARAMSVALYDAISTRFRKHHDEQEHRSDKTQGGVVHT